MHGGGDADDLDRVIMRADKQVLSDGIFAARILRPEAAGEALVDDGDERGAGVVARGEGAAVHERYGEGAEVVRARSAGRWRWAGG